MVKKFYKNFSAVLLLSLIVLISVILYKYFSNKNSGGSKKTISIWTVEMKSEFEKYMTYLIDKYKRDNKNIEIYWSDFPKNEIATKLYEAWQSQTLPDIVSLDTNTLVNGINSSLFVNLNGYKESLSILIFPRLLETNEKDEKLLGFPWYTDVKILFINKKIMSESGINFEQYPKTEEEFFKILEVVKQNSQKFGSILEPDNIENLIFNGFDILDENGNVKIDKNEIIEYFKFCQNLFKNSSVPREFSNFDDKISLYANGEVAMIKSSFQFVSSIKKISEEIYNDTVIFPIPLGKEGVRFSNTISLSIVNNGKDFTSSLDFIKFILSDMNQIELFNNFNVLPVNKNLIDNQEFVDSIPDNNKPKLTAFLSLEDSKDFVFNIEHQNKISNIIEKYSRSIYLDDVDVEVLIKEAQNDINNFYIRE